MRDQAPVPQTVGEFCEAKPSFSQPMRSDRLPLGVCILIWLGAGAALWTAAIYLFYHAASWVLSL